MKYIDDAIVIGLVIGLTQMMKGYISDKYTPLISLFFGIVGGITISGLSVEGAVKGVVFGLTASGLYDHSKIVKKTK